MDVKKFISDVRRIIKLAHKPDKQEFAKMVKVTGGAIVFIGILGAVIRYVFHILGFLGGP